MDPATMAALGGGVLGGIAGMNDKTTKQVTYTPPWLQSWQKSAANMAGTASGIARSGPFDLNAFGGVNLGRGVNDSWSRLFPTLQGNGKGMMNLASDMIAGKYLSPDSNPYLKDAMTAAIDPVTQQLQREILPSIKSSANLAGGMGGSRQGVAEGVATGDWARSAGDIRSSMLENNYQFERGNQMNAGTLMQQGMNLETMPIFQNMQVADWLNNLAMLDYNSSATLPYASAGSFADILARLANGNSQTDYTQPANPLGGALGGAMMGYSMMK